MAQRMRERDSFSAVSEEERQMWPAREEKMLIPTSQGETPAFLITPLDISNIPSPLIINFHGGGFIKGRQDRDELFCRRLACSAHVLTVDVDYRLAPEYPFPAALYESYDVIQWIFLHARELGADPGRIGILGHSAGGNLAAGSIILAGEQNAPMPKCLGIEYSPMDLNTDPDKKRRPDRDVSPERAKLYNSFYCKPSQTAGYLASPIFAGEEKLRAFPPSLIITAGDDSLADEGEEFAKHLIQAGIEVTAKRFTGCVHGFTVNRMDRYEESMELITRFFKSNL